MVNRMLLFSVAALSSLAKCSPPSVPKSAASCEADIASLSWKISDFEWRTGYITWSYSIGVGPAPPPPPTQSYICGEAMLRMNITSISTKPGDDTGALLDQEMSIPCIEQTNDAKLANITDMKDYNAGPWGPPPFSPHWFTCDAGSQLFIYPNGTIDPWAGMRQTGNLTTRIRMDPVEMTIEIGQSWACDADDGESGYVSVSESISTCHFLPETAAWPLDTDFSSSFTGGKLRLLALRTYLLLCAGAALISSLMRISLSTRPSCMGRDCMPLYSTAACVRAQSLLLRHGHCGRR